MASNWNICTLQYLSIKNKIFKKNWRGRLTTLQPVQVLIHRQKSHESLTLSR